jgi:hypothetical protein
MDSILIAINFKVQQDFFHLDVSKYIPNTILWNVFENFYNAACMYVCRYVQRKQMLNYICNCSIERLHFLSRNKIKNICTYIHIFICIYIYVVLAPWKFVDCRFHSNYEIPQEFEIEKSFSLSLFCSKKNRRIAIQTKIFNGNFFLGINGPHLETIFFSFLNRLLNHWREHNTVPHLSLSPTLPLPLSLPLSRFFGWSWPRRVPNGHFGSCDADLKLLRSCQALFLCASLSFLCLFAVFVC